MSERTNAPAKAEKRHREDKCQDDHLHAWPT
jgi:hypothetical protein